MRYSKVFWNLLLLALAFTACNLPLAREAAPGTTAPDNTGPAPSPAGPVALSSPDQLIQPDDLDYLGAFRLPASSGDPENSWEWGGSAMTYYPDGDPGGGDGFPGSLYAAGHDWYQYVAEVGIPAPVISASHALADLNTAETLQGFSDIRGDLFPHLDFELPRVGLEYLPPQGGQTTGKLHFCWGQHYQEGDLVPTHGWAELDLSDPQPAGAWHLGGFSNYAANDYLFAIPPEWAAQYTPGLLLASGRYRDGGWSGQGPSLFAYGPWNEGNPPPRGATLPAVALILYADTLNEPDGPTLNGYHHSDEWVGGAWLTAGERSAVIFVGTKGTGEYWYGFANGVVWPDEGPFPEIPDPPYDDRGWWSTGFEGQILFYDPQALVAVALGEMAPWEPQPYAVLNIDEALWHITSGLQKHHVSSVAYDRERGLLYIMEPFADGDQPIVHVWSVGG